MASNKVFIKHVCKTCGNEYEHWHYSSKFCSKKCYLKATYKNTREQQLSKDFQLQKMYGISLNTYIEMLKDQQGVCAICKQPETQIHKKTNSIMHLSVDHCHETGKVRGLLCKKCNMALGLLQDSLELIRNTEQYLLERGVK